MISDKAKLSACFPTVADIFVYDTNDMLINIRQDHAFVIDRPSNIWREFLLGLVSTLDYYLWKEKIHDRQTQERLTNLATRDLPDTLH